MEIIIGDKSNPFPQYGYLHTILSFKSQYADERRVDIWLPEGYDSKKKYAVLYMHDGQNLFNPSVGFHGQIWSVDVALQSLILKEKARPTIVVGVWNTGKRYQEYLPAPAFNLLPEELRSLILREHSNPGLRPMSDEYLRFLVEELKPFIDSNYSTYSDSSNTFVMGSSMGGLISAYAIAQYPEVFGGAGCVSTHWPLSLHLNDESLSWPFIQWLSENLPSPENHRLYFDFGTETIDAFYEIHQNNMDEVMRESGYEEGNNWMTLKDDGAPHSEAAWKNRVKIPLEFLLRP
jgi:predicted alpha/beta superfamily hydrolase